MSDDRDNVIDLWPYQENEMIDRAFEAMRREAQRNRELRLVASVPEPGTAEHDLAEEEAVNDA